MNDMNCTQTVKLTEHKRKRYAGMAKAKVDNEEYVSTFLAKAKTAKPENSESTRATLEGKEEQTPTSRRQQLTRDGLQMLYNNKKGLLDQMSFGQYSNGLRSDVKFLKQLLEELEDKSI